MMQTGHRNRDPVIIPSESSFTTEMTSHIRFPTPRRNTTMRPCYVKNFLGRSVNRHGLVAVFEKVWRSQHIHIEQRIQSIPRYSNLNTRCRMLNRANHHFENIRRDFLWRLPFPLGCINQPIRHFPTCYRNIASLAVTRDKPLFKKCDSPVTGYTNMERHSYHSTIALLGSLLSSNLLQFIVAVIKTNFIQITAAPDLYVRLCSKPLKGNKFCTYQIGIFGALSIVRHGAC